jgi:hypothetical protein
MRDSYKDFTESEYRKLLRAANENYDFIYYNKYKDIGKKILWRHDIDFSIHRAFKLAKIEHEEGVIATYFVHLHSVFYNPFESENLKLLQQIKEMNHAIGIHYDPEFYSSKIDSKNNFESWLLFEKEILGKILDMSIETFSMHNPDAGLWLDYDSNEIAGMINAYGRYFKEKYGYCSDSNGYWRHRRIHDVLADAKDENLQILTHPGWWVPEALSPRERIKKCVDGRAEAVLNNYNQALINMGRKNIQ